MTTVFDVCSKLYPLGTNVLIARKQGQQVLPITHGLKPRRAPREPGVHLFTVAELLALSIPYMTANGTINGYQRGLEVSHARNIARALQAGKPLPPIEVALDDRGNMSIIDGQHRTVGAVLAGVPIEGHIKHRSLDEQRELFAGQRRARPVDRNVLVLAGDSPYELYIQDAVTSSEHPWSPLVSSSAKSKTKVSAHTALALILGYVSDAIENGSRLTPHQIERWNSTYADEMAPLLTCFGNKKSNPLAFSATNVRAIGHAATLVFRRRNADEADYDRWVRHMPGFQFRDYAYIRRSSQMLDELLEHWNKRLPVDSSRRVKRS